MQPTKNKRITKTRNNTKEIQFFHGPTKKKTPNSKDIIFCPCPTCSVWIRHRDSSSGNRQAAAPGLQRSLCRNSLTLAPWTYLQNFAAEWCCKTMWNGRVPLESPRACRFSMSVKCVGNSMSNDRWFFCQICTSLKKREGKSTWSIDRDCYCGHWFFPKWS